jgi:hypothetical protein
MGLSIYARLVLVYAVLYKWWKEWLCFLLNLTLTLSFG